MSKFAEIAKDMGLEGSTALSASVLLAAMHVGANRRRVATELDVPEGWIERFWSNYRDQGVFVGGKVVVDWLDDDDDSRGVGFLCDVMVGEGLLERA